MLCRLQRPSALVSELDRFIVGQSEAKRAVAVALRKRAHHTAIGGSALFGRCCIGVSLRLLR